MAEALPILRPGAVALVSGASRGIGLAIVEALVARKVRVVALARRKAPLAALAGRLGEAVHPVVLDVRDAEACAGLVEALPPAWRAIDILVNNAGADVGGRRDFAVGEIADWAGTIETNVIGLMRTTRAVLPGMLARGRGHIVNLGSISGTRALAGQVAYTTSKAAIAMFSQSLRAELKESAIRVSEIRPGTVRTDFAEVRFRGDAGRAAAFYDSFKAVLSAEDVARTVLFALEQPPHVAIAELLVLPTGQA